MKRDTNTLNNNIDEIESVVKVQLHYFMVSSQFSWCKSYRDFDFLLTWHKHLTRNNWEVKINLFFEIGLD
jgi:hypothetical protein